MARPRRRTAAPGSLGAFVGAGPRETGLGHGDMETLPTWRRYVPRERVAACSVRTNALRQPRPCLREADGTTRLPSAGFSHTHPRRCKLQDKGRGVHYRNVRLFHPATSWDVNNSVSRRAADPNAEGNRARPRRDLARWLSGSLRALVLGNGHLVAPPFAICICINE